MEIQWVHSVLKGGPKRGSAHGQTCTFTVARLDIWTSALDTAAPSFVDIGFLFSGQHTSTRFIIDARAAQRGN